MSKRISFYSFKGGSGRSTGLCNVAYTLAAEGANVGIIDFDIEAAGLNYILNISRGLLNKKKTLQHYLIDPNDIGRLDDLVIDFDEISRQNKPWNDEVDGNLYFLPAGQDAELTSEVVEVEGLFPVIGDLYDRFDEHADLDYLLLDSRSGISNLAIPTLGHADEITVFFRYSKQHREGTKVMVRWLNRNLAPFGQPEIFAVPSSVPMNVTVSRPDGTQMEITEEAVDEWMDKNIADQVRDYCIVPESDLLKVFEQIITAPSHPDANSPAAEGYRQLAGSLRTD